MNAEDWRRLAAIMEASYAEPGHVQADVAARLMRERADELDGAVEFVANGRIGDDPPPPVSPEQMDELFREGDELIARLGHTADGPAIPPCPWCAVVPQALLPGTPPLCGSCKKPLLIRLGAKGMTFEKPYATGCGEVLQTSGYRCGQIPSAAIYEGRPALCSLCTVRAKAEGDK